MARAEIGRRELASATSTSGPTNGGGTSREQTIVPVIRPGDVGATVIKPAGPPTRVGQGF